MTLKLRDYQVEAVTAVRNAWDGGTDSVIGVAAMGMGKTIILLETLAQERDAGKLERAIVLAHRRELIYQPQERVEKFFIGRLPVPGVVMGNENHADAEVICATVQTLSRERRMNEVLKHGRITHLIIDEAHHAAASGYQAVVDRLRAAYPKLRILGVTATPRRSDDVALTVFKDQVFKFTIKNAINEHKVLVPFVAMGVKLPVDISRVKMQQGDYSAGELGNVMDVKNSNEVIVETWRKHASNRVTMGFTPTVAHAKHLAEAFQEAGIAAEWAYAETPSAERDAMIGRLRRGETKVLLNCFLWTEGLDVPEIDCVMMARPTQSTTVYQQAVGRGLRTAPGKENCLILDFVPSSNKSLLTANALLTGKPLEQKEAEETAMKQGTILEVIGMDSKGNGIDADPDTVIMEALNLLGSQPIAWTFDGGLATAGASENTTIAIIKPDEARIAKADALKAEGNWDTAWDAAYERITSFQVYAINGKVYSLGTAPEWGQAVQIAQAYVEDHGDPMLSERSKGWRGQASTQGQRNMMKHLGLEYKAGMTRGQCSQAIAHKIAEKELRKVKAL